MNQIKKDVNEMLEISPIIWEERYSKSLEDDKYNRWMRIGRINGMTVAIITKIKIDNKPIRYLLRLPNNSGDESLSTNLIFMDEQKAKNMATNFMRNYIDSLLVKVK